MPDLNQDPLNRARAVRRALINPNIRGIHRAIGVDDSGKERSIFTYSALVEAAYWHLANAVDGGIVKRCERSGCGALFIQTHGKQRHCPPRWNHREGARKQESPCALSARQTKLQAGRRELLKQQLRKKVSATVSATEHAKRARRANHRF
jgi:hypothetical protein